MLKYSYSTIQIIVLPSMPLYKPLETSLNCSHKPLINPSKLPGKLPKNHGEFRSVKVTRDSSRIRKLFGELSFRSEGSVAVAPARSLLGRVMNRGHHRWGFIYDYYDQNNFCYCYYYYYYQYYHFILIIITIVILLLLLLYYILLQYYDDLVTSPKQFPK